MTHQGEQFFRRYKSRHVNPIPRLLHPLEEIRRLTGNQPFELSDDDEVVRNAVRYFGERLDEAA